MPKPISDNLDWRNVDDATLGVHLKALYDDLKAAQRLAAQARDAFEAAFTELAELPPTQSLKFGYRFGKLAIAIANEPAPKRNPAKAALDMAAIRDLARYRAS